jgi:putative flippase GtrA
MFHHPADEKAGLHRQMSGVDAFSNNSMTSADEDQAIDDRCSPNEAGVRDALLGPANSFRPRRFGQLDRNSIITRAWLINHRAQISRLARYAATSGLAFALSEATLLILYGSGIANATLAAVIANLAGTVPSYLMSRYWIWKDAPRARVARQVVLYWCTSIICIILTSLATGAIADLVPAGHRFHLAIVGVGFLVVNVIFWLGKFVLYQKVIFPTTRSR